MILSASFSSLCELLISELSAAGTTESPGKRCQGLYHCDNAAAEDFMGLLMDTTVLTEDTFQDLKWRRRGVLVGCFIALLFQFTVH